MPRSSEEFPSQAVSTALPGEPDILVIPEPDRELTDSRSATETPKASTLIEFPGVSRRSEPPWRRELSRRVREVQERRAKEVAETPESTTSRKPPARDPVLTQLELVPEPPTPTMNQLVENALRRVERARRADEPPEQSWSQSGPVSSYGAATAVARAKARAPDESEPGTLPLTEPAPPAPLVRKPRRSLTRRKLVIVPPAEPEPDKAIARPVRMIADGVDDAALSYLDYHFPETDADFVINQAGFGRRMISALFDFVVVLILAAPFAAAIEVVDVGWTDPLVVALMTAVLSFVVLAYQTFSIALSGQTWGMRLFSLRTVDPRTGLIPTGTQSVKRALGYAVSVWTLGLGLLFALVDSEHRTPHDRFSGTIVVRE